MSAILLLILPLGWLAAAIVVVAACQMASASDARYELATVAQAP